MGGQCGGGETWQFINLITTVGYPLVAKGEGLTYRGLID